VPPLLPSPSARSGEERKWFSNLIPNTKSPVAQAFSQASSGDRPRDVAPLAEYFTLIPNLPSGSISGYKIICILLPLLP